MEDLKRDKDHPAGEGGIDRRGFLGLTGRAGVWGAAAGLSGGVLGYGSRISRAAGERAGASPDRPYHHTDEGFRNPPGSPGHKHDLTAWLKHIRRELTREDPEIPGGHFLGHEAALRGLSEAGAGNRITWLGHSAFLLHLGGLNILLDPFLSDYATGMPPFGPKRYTPPGLPVDKLPRIDLLLISHNHYDHLDEATLRALPGKGGIQVVVPLKLKPLLSELGFGNITELDWHQSVSFGPVRVTGLPAVHYSARGLFDRNETLWCGYAISDPRTRVYFSGDTGHHPIFKELGRRHGPFDLGLVPIGAYQRASGRKSTHTTPEEAVALGRDLGARTLIPIHWGSLVLSYEPPFEPPARFLEAGRQAGFREDRLWKMAVGETRQLRNL